MKKPIGRVLLLLSLVICAWPVAAAAQSESAGVAQYFNNCASCHESTDSTHQAPRTALLKQMTPEHVLEVLTNGSMRSNAAALSDTDKRLIAEWVGGRKIDNELVGDADKMTNPIVTVTKAKKVTISGLTLAGIYQFQIRAFGVLGYTDWMDTKTFVVA